MENNEPDIQNMFQKITNLLYIASKYGQGTVETLQQLNQALSEFYQKYQYIPNYYRIMYVLHSHAVQQIRYYLKRKGYKNRRRFLCRNLRGWPTIRFEHIFLQSP